MHGISGGGYRSESNELLQDCSFPDIRHPSKGGCQNPPFGYRRAETIREDYASFFLAKRWFGYVGIAVQGRHSSQLLQMQNAIAGLHHVTAIASDAQRNLDFYTIILGLRLVKRTVNFDAPETYHFYFGDSNGTPGSLLTFFPWPNARQSIRGTGQIEATSFKISSESMGYWLKRLEQQHAFPERMPTRFGEEVIRFVDPDGLLLELVASLPTNGTSTSTREPWVQSTVPSEHQLNGLHSVTSAVVGYEGTANLLVDSFGYQLIQEVGNRFRFLAPGSGESGTIVDLVSQPDSQRGLGGAGSVHHVAFRVSSEQEQKVWREKLISLGYNVSPIMDRAYFRSLYFREPGGLLFELATDLPGFTADEPLQELGTHLCLPAQFERRREKIEQMLPPITLSTTRLPE